MGCTWFSRHAERLRPPSKRQRHAPPAYHKVELLLVPLPPDYIDDNKALKSSIDELMIRFGELETKLAEEKKNRADAEKRLADADKTRADAEAKLAETQRDKKEILSTANTKLRQLNAELNHAEAMLDSVQNMLMEHGVKTIYVQGRGNRVMIERFS
jgi:septal ring factor EnvC (AmiA/AmiB activator)